MTVEEIIAYARQQLDDEEEDYFWSDLELFKYLVKVYNRFCRKTRMIRDSTTSACSIPILSDVHTYDLDDAILSINSLSVESRDLPLEQKDTGYLDAKYYAWRADSSGDPRLYIPDYSTGTIRFIPYYGEDGDYDDHIVTGTMTFAVGDSSVTLAAGGFTAAGYAIDDEVDIDATLNDGVFTIASVIDTKLTFDEAIATEIVSATIRQVEDTASLEVTRLGSLTFASRATQSPEIHEDYHYDLVDGMRALAYKKPDTQTFNPKAAEEAEVAFRIAIAEAKRDLIERRTKSRILSPHPGTV